MAILIVLTSACITVVQPGGTSTGQQPSGGKPAAYIDLISPTSAPWGSEVRFTGHGTPASGSITAYRWRSTIDGDLGSQASFTSTALSPGNHIVLFSVQDGSGNWSLETQGTVTITTDAGDTGTPPPPDSGPPPADPGSGAPPVTPPVISSFSAAPTSIAAGSTSTLTWNVSNATAVTISHGVGSVALSGSSVVSPAASTTYTLTAANMGYFSQATTTVTVTAAVTKPDLIIEDLWKSGDHIYYRIRNQGSAAAPATVSKLTIDGADKSTDSVPALAAGAASTQNFSAYVYSCSGVSDSVVVKADSTNVAMESNGANNSLTKSLSCLVLGPVAPVGPLLALKPDLIVTNIGFLPPPSGKVTFTVKNNGTLAAGGFDVRLVIGGILRDTSHIGALNAGATASGTFNNYHHICVVGSHATVKVEVDPGGAVTESDETNNSRSEWWGCPPAP
jgi:subtilase family serine protease